MVVIIVRNCFTQADHFMKNLSIFEAKNLLLSRFCLLFSTGGLFVLTDCVNSQILLCTFIHWLHVTYSIFTNIYLEQFDCIKQLARVVRYVNKDIFMFLCQVVDEHLRQMIFRIILLTDDSPDIKATSELTFLVSDLIELVFQRTCVKGVLQLKTNISSYNWKALHQLIIIISSILTYLPKK